jgi:hypothetical protein
MASIETLRGWLTVASLHHAARTQRPGAKPVQPFAFATSRPS